MVYRCTCYALIHILYIDIYFPVYVMTNCFQLVSYVIRCRHQAFVEFALFLCKMSRGESADLFDTGTTLMLFESYVYNAIIMTCPMTRGVILFLIAVFLIV